MFESSSEWCSLAVALAGAWRAARRHHCRDAGPEWVEGCKDEQMAVLGEPDIDPDGRHGCTESIAPLDSLALRWTPKTGH